MKATKEKENKLMSEDEFWAMYTPEAKAMSMLTNMCSGSEVGFEEAKKIHAHLSKTHGKGASTKED